MDSDLLRVLDEASARQLPALIADWQHAADERHWIARALRVDLALLTERPDIVVPCLVRRCALAGAEGGFYLERAAVDLGALPDTIERWAAHAPRPWLRALRPPPIPIDGAVVEEYRTGLPGMLWISDDGERIGVVGDTAHVAWERATGRRLDVPRPAAGPTLPRWVCGRDNTYGRIVLERGDHRLELAIDDDDIARGAFSITDELLLVTCDVVDGGGFSALVDVDARRFVWRVDGPSTSAVVLDRERLLLGFRDRLDTVAITTGDVLASWHCPPIGELQALPDGNVVTRTGSVVRVWNVGEAVARPQVVHPDRNSWTSAAFSPDGEHLVTEQLLCDGRTGRLIAQLRCNGPDGWLEGGPPRGCQRLCTGVFAEITPFGLTLWDSATGRQLLRDRERRARIADCVAFDPTGQYHAIWSERGSLQVYRLADGTLVRELAQPLPRWTRERRLGFSPDGTLLAWENADGERRVMSLAAPFADGPLAPDEDPCERAVSPIAVEDGLLWVADAAIPCDDASVVVAPGGRGFAGRQCHYALVA